MDLREALAGLLTLSMFIMLGNMIKKDHFDAVEEVKLLNWNGMTNEILFALDDVKVDLPTTSVSQSASTVGSGQSLATVSHVVKRPWKHSGEGIKPCWNPPPLKEAEQSKGFITFSLTNGPEYHIPQIADAVVVARYLGATLVLPDIKGSKPGHNTNLGDAYDVQNILNGLHGMVRVTRKQPAQVSNTNPPIIKVPNRVSEDYIVKKILPIYKSKGMVKIESYFPSVTTTRAMGNKNNMDTFACHAMFGTLKLQSDIQEVVDSMVQKLQAWSQDSKNGFVAVDLRKECHIRDDSGKRVCYQAKEIGEFLKKIGFDQETVIYVTRNKWGPDLDALRDLFPKTYAKENVMSAREKGSFLDSKNSSEFEKIIDFHVCSQSEVFVPSILDLFYTNVAGMRIASGKTQILVPDEKASPSASPSNYMSPYISQKSHFAYSCFC